MNARIFTALAIGVSLTGCALLPNMGQLNNLLQSNPAVRSLVYDTAAALQADSELDQGGVIADDGYTTASVDAAAGADVTAGGTQASAGASLTFREKMKQRAEKYKQKAAAKLDARRQALKQKPTREEIDNQDGTWTVKTTMSFEHKNGSRSQVIAKTFSNYKAEGQALVKAEFSMERTGKDGRAHKVSRTRTYASEGTWTGHFENTITRDGKTKSVVWDRQLGADGLETGEGKITRFDGSTVTITIKKDENGQLVTTVVDSKASTEATITKDEAAAEATVEVKQNGRVAGTTTVNVEEVEATDE